MIDAIKMCQAAGVETPSYGPTAAAVLDDSVGLEPITLQQAKDHLRVVGGDDDTYIASLITAARQMAESRLNRTLVRRTRRAVFDVWGEGLALPKPPLQSVEAVRYVDADGITQSMDSALYRVNTHSEPGRITAAYRANWPRFANQDGGIEVEYTAGYDVVPGPIIQWMLLAIGTMYNNRESVVNGVTSGALGDDFVRWLLQPYMVYE